jgi:hypothetical protein
MADSEKTLEKMKEIINSCPPKLRETIKKTTEELLEIQKGVVQNEKACMDALPTINEAGRLIQEVIKATARMNAGMIREAKAARKFIWKQSMLKNTSRD